MEGRAGGSYRYVLFQHIQHCIFLLTFSLKAVKAVSLKVETMYWHMIGTGWLPLNGRVLRIIYTHTGENVHTMHFAQHSPEHFLNGY